MSNLPPGVTDAMIERQLEFCPLCAYMEAVEALSEVMENAGFSDERIADVVDEIDASSDAFMEMGTVPAYCPDHDPADRRNWDDNYPYEDD